MFRTTMSSLLAAGMICSGPAQAQTLYKCVSKGKPTSFQSEPCSGLQREAKAVAYTPDAVGPYRPDTASRPYQASGYRSQATATTITKQTTTACEIAKSTRDQVLGRNNQSGGYEVRVRLNDAVQRACN